MSFAIKGGSSGDNAQKGASNNYSIFKPGIFWHKLSTKKSETVRLLPAFDYSLSTADAAFKESYVAYRDVNLPTDETNTPGFTEWYFNLNVYSFWGAEKRSFISRTTGTTIPPKGVDPVYDLYSYAKNSDNLAYKKLTEKGKTLEDQAILRFPQVLCVSNGLMENDMTHKLENKIVCYTNTALKDLKNALKKRAGRGDKVISPKWDMFMLGDVTDPETGAVANTVAKVVGVSTIKTACFAYTDDPESLDGYVAHTFNPKSKEGKAFLAGRYNIMDTDNVLIVPTYEEVLEYVLAEPSIPFELVDAVCSRYTAAALKKPTHPVVSSPAPQSKGFGSPPKPKPAATGSPGLQGVKGNQHVEEEEFAPDEEPESSVPETGDSSEVAALKAKVIAGNISVQELQRLLSITEGTN